MFEIQGCLVLCYQSDQPQLSKLREFDGRKSVVICLTSELQHAADGVQQRRVKRMNQNSVQELCEGSLGSAIAQIAEDTGVSKEAVAAVLERIGLTKSLNEALQFAEPTTINSVTANNIVAGVKLAQTMIHK